MTRFALLCALILGCGDDSAPADAAPDTTDAPSDAGPDVMMPDASDAGPCGECSAPTPLCNTTTMMCVTCLSETDCSGDTPLCDDDGACVACLGNDDCSGNTPICTDGSCTACTADPQCTELTDTPVCHEPTGACVACTADTEVEQCGEFSCSRLTLTCTETERGFLDTCDPCEADSECAAGRRCVLHRFMDTDIGHFCFLDSEGGCGDTDVTLRPYRTRLELDSIDGVTATYCMPPGGTTCAGINDTQSVACTEDSECGIEDLDDGFCPPIGPGANLCSYTCTGAVECAAGLECAGTPQHCRPPS